MYKGLQLFKIIKIVEPSVSSAKHLKRNIQISTKKQRFYERKFRSKVTAAYGSRNSLLLDVVTGGKAFSLRKFEDFTIFLTYKTSTQH